MADPSVVSDASPRSLRHAMEQYRRDVASGVPPADAHASLKIALRRFMPARTDVKPYACTACRDSGFLIVTATENERQFAARCLCLRGLKQSTGLPIDAVVPPEQLHAYFPDGLPVVSQSIAPRLDRIGIPERAKSWTVETFNAHFARNAQALRYAAWTSLWAAKSISTRSDLMLVGSHGTGKTGLSVLVARACAERHERARWWYVPELMTEWRSRFERGGEREFQLELIGYDVLVLDEFAGASLSEFVQQSLTTIIHRRQQEMRPTVLTMNAPTMRDGSINTNALASMLGPALYDRLIEHGELWPLVGESARPVYRRS